uniref:Uncharacterized protein n=1 Tax=viral metagenome TaxID=1070528 RepID=A0A6C0I432_9ZZZZ
MYYEIFGNTIPLTTPSLGYNTNNKYPDFPPLMSDGRSVTSSWQPEAVINASIIQANGIKTNWEYRQFLTNNAVEIMKYNFLESSTDVGYYKRPIDLPSIRSNIVSGPNTVPYQFKSYSDKAQPFSYSTSDLKEMYLSREELNSRKVSPVITQEQLYRST